VALGDVLWGALALQEKTRLGVANMDVDREKAQGRCEDMVDDRVESPVETYATIVARKKRHGISTSDSYATVLCPVFIVETRYCCHGMVF